MGFSWARLVLIVGVALVALVLVRGQGVRHVALRRLGLAVFVLAALAAIIFPDVVTDVARLIGVGRGADLLLYALVVVFSGYVAVRSRRDRRIESHLTVLARRQALSEAPPPRP